MMRSLNNLILFISLLALTQVSCSKVEPKHGETSHGTESASHGEHQGDVDSKEHSSEVQEEHHQEHHDVVKHKAKSQQSDNHHEDKEDLVANHHSGKERKKGHESKDENCGVTIVKHESSKAEHKVADSGVPADKSFLWLKNGNKRYIRGAVRKDGQSKNDRLRLASGQKPHAIVLSCSDSRVPPEVLFDQKLGEIFVVRTAGEALDDAAIASIEYAVEHLGSHLLVVMAHESCGAVKAAFSTLGGGDAGSPSLNALVKDIHPRIKRFLGKQPSENFLSESKANAVGVARDLLARSEIVSSKVKEDLLQIETAVYHLSSGWVEFYSAPPSRGLASEK